MPYAFVGAAFAVVLVGSTVTFAADISVKGGNDAPTVSVTTDATPTPPASLKCKAPKVPTEVTVKGKTTWKCKVPPTLPGSASN